MESQCSTQLKLSTLCYESDEKKKLIQIANIKIFKSATPTFLQMIEVKWYEHKLHNVKNNAWKNCVTSYLVICRIFT